MAGTKENEFWAWFKANELMLYRFEADRERTFDLLMAEMHKVDPRLTFEFGPIQDDDWREFVISADGVRDAFPAVENLFAAAPRLERWKFVKFRPRRAPMQVCVGKRCVEPEEVHFRLFRDQDKIGILLIFDRYDEKERNFFLQAGYLFLDQALGEFTVETEVGFIEFADRTTEYFEKELQLPILAREFDAALMQK